MKAITIFLDFDGVLNTHSYRRANTFDNIYVVDQTLVSNLSQAIKSHSDVKFDIVISSSWRFEIDQPEYYEVFLGKYITGLINKDRPFTPKLNNRDKDIVSYLNSVDVHGRPIRINEFIIIDDIRMDTFYLKRRQVLTDDWSGGFDAKAVEDFHRLVTQ